VVQLLHPAPFYRTGAGDGKAAGFIPWPSHGMVAGSDTAARAPPHLT
jgi:hypothetical protein